MKRLMILMSLLVASVSNAEVDGDFMGYNNCLKALQDVGELDKYIWLQDSPAVLMHKKKSRVVLFSEEGLTVIPKPKNITCDELEGRVNLKKFLGVEARRSFRSGIEDTTRISKNIGKYDNILQSCGDYMLIASPNIKDEVSDMRRQFNQIKKIRSSILEGEDRGLE